MMMMMAPLARRSPVFGAFTSVRLSSTLSQAFDRVRQVRQLDESCLSAVREWIRQLQEASSREVVPESELCSHSSLLQFVTFN